METTTPSQQQKSPDQLIVGGLGIKNPAAEKPDPKAGGGQRQTELPAAAKPGDGKAPEGYIPASDVERMIRESVDRAVRETTDKSRTERETADNRERFIRQNMGDLPLILQNAMPKTGTAAELAKAEQDIRGEFRGYLQKLASEGKIVIPNVGGQAKDSGGVAPSAVINDQRSPYALITAGLKKRKPNG